MSTKDLIERVTRSPGTTRTVRGSTHEPEPEKDVRQKRVGDGVIRRRRVASEAPSEPVTPVIPPPSAAIGDLTGRTVVRRRAAPAEPPAAPLPSPAAAPPPAAAAPVETAQPVPEQASAPVVEPEVQAQAPDAQEAPAAVAEAAPAPEPAPEPAPVEAAAEVVAPAAVEAAPVEPAPEPTEAVPSLPEPEAVAAQPEAEPVSAQPAHAAAPAPMDDATAHAVASATLAKSLPRADGSRPNPPRLKVGDKGGPRFPGLGSAVVSPPPGYDPTDPAGNRRRAEQAARPAAPAPRPEAPAEGSTEQPWRDERGVVRGAPGARPADDRRTTPARGKKRKGGRSGMMEVQDGMGLQRRRRRVKGKAEKKASPQAKQIKRRVEVDGNITVANLAHAMAVKSGQVVKALIELGQMATANDTLDFETAILVAQEFGHEVMNASFQENEHLIGFTEEDEDQEIRPPVVTIMGHVDHGKTSLLDTIRKANVAGGEAGGITQHMAAYQVLRDGNLITFIDTPGHEAFTAMRARGAMVTDIVVLVVAADDGVMPQTVEAINHAKAAGVPIIVAVNKIDKPNATPARVRQALMEFEMVAEEFGGETIFVDVSATKQIGIEELLDSILLVAEVEEFSANADRHAEGHVLEARLERGKGVVATLLVEAGTLKQGDSVVLGSVWGRVRAMNDHNGKPLKSAGPSTPVEIIGLQDLPEAGDDFVVVASDKDAKSLTEHRSQQQRDTALASNTRITLEDLLSRSAGAEKVVLNLVVKSDVGGTLEAMKHSLAKIEIPGTEIKLLHSAVGAITESDASLAHTYGGIIIGFNVRPDAKAREAVDAYGVEVRTYKVIYEALEDVEKALKGLLAPEIREVVQGHAEIRQTFSVPKIGTVAGCFIVDGKVARSHLSRLTRDGRIIWEGRLASLRRFKDDVREVEKGYECGMNLEGYNDIKVGDVIETYTREQVAALS